MHVKPGETVAAGAPLLTLYTDTPDTFDVALADLDGAWTIATDPRNGSWARSTR